MARAHLLSIVALLGLVACGDDSPAGGSSAGGGGNAPTNGGGGSGAGDIGGSGGAPLGGGGAAAGGAATGGAAAGGAAAGGAAEGGAGGGCVPLTEDDSAIGTNCADAVCPPEYTCQGHDGFVFQQLCAILCTEDCECPTGYTCTMQADKNSQWMECLGG
jgi:hypothetical protein